MVKIPRPFLHTSKNPRATTPGNVASTAKDQYLYKECASVSLTNQSETQRCHLQQPCSPVLATKWCCSWQSHTPHCPIPNPQYVDSYLSRASCYEGRPRNTLGIQCPPKTKGLHHNRTVSRQLTHLPKKEKSTLFGRLFAWGQHHQPCLDV